MRQISFTRPCRVAVMTPEGDMVAFRFGMGETVDVINTVPSVVTLEAVNDLTHTFELSDGTVLMDVPVENFRWEPEYVDCGGRDRW